MKKVRIILIGNYFKDKQESMLRFANMLESGYKAAGYETEIWRPLSFFASAYQTTDRGLGKWLGYLDKWILFPLILKWRIVTQYFNHQNVRFHICDHSNSPYLKYLPYNITAITCHDVIAIRGGMGVTDAYVTTSSFGKILQKRILYHLSCAKLVAAVSQLTLDQLLNLTKGKMPLNSDWRVIYNAFNANFAVIEKQTVELLLAKVNVNTPFMLHVGSDLERKNRKLLLDMAHSLGNGWDGEICFAGKPMDQALIGRVELLGLQDRVKSVENPDHDTLVALYNACEAFIFPSFSEGFGWPVIEAQACGAPILASNIQPMPEVSGGAAIHIDPNKPDEFARAFMSIKNNTIRKELMEKGLENSKRFSVDVMIGTYLELFGLAQ